MISCDSYGVFFINIWCFVRICLHDIDTFLICMWFVCSFCTGTFLVPYLTIAIVFGVPLLFLEITLGQFCQQGTTKLWRAVPLLKGIARNVRFRRRPLDDCNLFYVFYFHRLGVGFVKILASVLLAAYYPIIMALSLFYGTRSMTGTIPFPECSNSVGYFVSVTCYYYCYCIRTAICRVYYGRIWTFIVWFVTSQVGPWYSNNV